jgi:hypothetical protein
VRAGTLVFARACLFFYLFTKKRRKGMSSPDLFDEFAAAEAGLREERQHHGEQLKARAISVRRQRIELRRAKTEAVLFEVLPPTLDMGTSYHVISHGDVDALSYLIHIMKSGITLDSLLISTWCMAAPDVDWLRAQCEAWRIGRIDFVLGEIFPASYPDEYDAIEKMQALEMATMKIARNHAKIMAGCHADSGCYFAIESSSNVNTNPRIEQTAIHMSRELHDFYVEFYDGVKSIDGSRYKKPKHDHM